MQKPVTRTSFLVVIGTILIYAMSVLRPAPPLILFNVDGSGSADRVRPRYLAIMDALVTALPSGTRSMAHRCDGPTNTPANRLVDTCGESKWFTFCGA
jgi:hypothetical protein